MIPTGACWWMESRRPCFVVTLSCAEYSSNPASTALNLSSSRRWTRCTSASAPSSLACSWWDLQLQTAGGQAHQRSLDPNLFDRGENAGGGGGVNARDPVQNRRSLPGEVDGGNVVGQMDDEPVLGRSPQRDRHFLALVIIKAIVAAINSRSFAPHQVQLLVAVLPGHILGAEDERDKFPSRLGAILNDANSTLR